MYALCPIIAELIIIKLNSCYSYGVTAGAEAFANSLASGVEGVVVGVDTYPPQINILTTDS